MEQLFKTAAGYLALGIEGAAVLLIVFGAAEALLHIFRPQFKRESSLGVRLQAWRRFAVWLILGLEFELGADVIRTAISPTWTDIGQLGAIAAIRTVLNYFLEKDLAEYSERRDRLEEPPVKEAT